MNLRTALPMAAVVMAGTLATSAAQARTEVTIQIGLPLPSVIVQTPPPVVTAPVVVVPRVQPVPVYTRPVPVYTHPGWVSYPPPAYIDRDRDGIPDRYDRYDNRRLPAAKPHDHRHHGKRVDDRGRHDRKDHRDRHDWR